jgi:hypothetical protein
MATALVGAGRNRRMTLPPFSLPLTAGLLVAATGALAQEAAPAPQEIESAFTWSAIDLTPTLPMGEGRDVYLIESFLVVSSTDGPLAGMAARCLVMGENDLATFGYTESGTCVYQDASGDQLWERFEGATEGNGAPSVGTATLIGGTGRFEGASGETSYENTFSASTRAGVYQGTGTKRGSLVLPAG